MEVTVYILRCSDGSYYTGLTKQEIEARVWEHNKASTTATPKSGDR
jgi:putative endonuclease